MPVPKKKRITAENARSTSQASSLPLPEQQECASAPAGSGSKRGAHRLGTGDA